jgi:hypothetical protein
MGGILSRRAEPGAPRGEAANPERAGRFAAVGVAVSRLAQPIIGKRGSLARLKAHWTAIAGPEWGEVSWPLSLGRDGVLKLRVASSAALELQHRAPLLIARVNLYLGREVVSRMTLVQGPLRTRAPAPFLRPLAEEEARALQGKLSGIADSALREALDRLGRAIRGREE